jgi:hypothetical protein
MDQWPDACYQRLVCKPYASNRERQVCVSSTTCASRGLTRSVVQGLGHGARGTAVGLAGHGRVHGCVPAGWHPADRSARPRRPEGSAASFLRQEGGQSSELKHLESELLPGDRLHCRVHNGSIPLARKECAMAKESTMPTSRASLCALGESLKRCCFFAPLREQGQVPQKTVRSRPIDKVLDGL